MQHGLTECPDPSALFTQAVLVVLKSKGQTCIHVSPRIKFFSSYDHVLDAMLSWKDTLLLLLKDVCINSCSDPFRVGM